MVGATDSGVSERPAAGLCSDWCGRRRRGGRLNPDAGITVVLPVLNEAVTLPLLLADIRAQRGIDVQVIVADGGSSDDSVGIARRLGADVVLSVPGRGAQMNAGAALARCEWLCFLHADSRLTHPDQLADAIQMLLGAGATRVVGHFALRFIRYRSNRRFFYRYLEAKTETGRRYTINGDQGLMLRRDFFTQIGGFDTGLAFLEDQRLAARIARDGQWRLLPHRLATSARRFETEGEGSRYLLMALVMAMHGAGVRVFFTQARDLYVPQTRASRLALMPYFRLLRRLRRDCGWRASLAVAWRIAGLTLDEAWQPFFALDVALEPLLGRRRLLTGLYDRVLRHALVHPPGRVLVLVLFPLVIFGPLQGCYALRERSRLRA